MPPTTTTTTTTSTATSSLTSMVESEISFDFHKENEVMIPQLSVKHRNELVVIKKAMWQKAWVVRWGRQKFVDPLFVILQRLDRSLHFVSLFSFFFNPMTEWEVLRSEKRSITWCISSQIK